MRAEFHGVGLRLDVSFPAEFDQAFAIKFGELQRSEFFVKRDEAEALGTADLDPLLVHVLAVECEQLRKNFASRDLRVIAGS